MSTIIPGYGLWFLAAINAAFFIFFAWSFYKPMNARDWRSFGLFAAFVVALFAEMYGFPLTLFLLSGWLSSRFPQVDCAPPKWPAHVTRIYADNASINARPARERESRLPSLHNCAPAMAIRTARHAIPRSR